VNQSSRELAADALDIRRLNHGACHGAPPGSDGDGTQAQVLALRRERDAGLQ